MSNQQVTRSRPTMWDKEQMFHFIEKMCEIPKQFDGLRRAGYEADAAVRNFLENELKSLGINDVTQKEISFTKEMYTKWELLINNQKFPCYFLRGAKFTDEQGIEAELLYVGNTIKGHDVKNKIIVLEIVSQNLYLDSVIKLSDFVYDPSNSLQGKVVPSANMPANWPTEYYDAYTQGALGILVILPFESGTNKFYPDVSLRVEQKLPGLYIGKKDGEELKKLAQQKAKAKIILTGYNDPYAKSANVVGFLKGETDDAIIISSHADSSFNGAVQDATGVSVVLALASYYAQVPSYYRQKDIYFVLDANHYEWHYPQGAWELFKQYPQLKDNACLGLFVEHIGLDSTIKNDKYVPTNESLPAFLFSPSNNALLAITKFAMQQHQLDKTIIPSKLLPGYPGEGRASYFNNIPTYNFITGPEYVFLEDDNLEFVDKDRLEKVTKVFLEIIDWAMYKSKSTLTTIN